jgi:hypothetical protein
MGRRPSRLPLRSENIENKALKAVHATQLAAVTFGKTAKWSVPAVTAHSAPVRVRLRVQARRFLVVARDRLVGAEDANLRAGDATHRRHRYIP